MTRKKSKGKDIYA
jgi:hypothetical protein